MRYNYVSRRANSSPLGVIMTLKQFRIEFDPWLRLDIIRILDTGEIVGRASDGTLVQLGSTCTLEDTKRHLVETRCNPDKW